MDKNVTQFRVSLVPDRRNCFGTCRCGGNVPDFVARKEGVGLRDAALLLCEWFDLPMGSSPAVQSGKPTRERGAQKPNSPPDGVRREVARKPKEDAPQDDADQPNKPLGFALQHLDSAHPYLGSPDGRGLSAECIAQFGLGFCEKGSMAGRIVIPIHNAEGQLVVWGVGNC
jgi:DNA primase